jgi:hypothetical protein
MQLFLQDDRLKLDFYGESLCPDCIELVTGQFKIAVSTPDIEKIANINYYSHGKSKETFDATT